MSDNKVLNVIENTALWNECFDSMSRGEYNSKTFSELKALYEKWRQAQESEEKKKVKVFRKQLWIADLQRVGKYNETMQSLTWPDKMDGQVVPEELEYLFMAEWTEEVEA